MEERFQGKFNFFRKWASYIVLPLSILGIVGGVMLNVSLLTWISLILATLTISLWFMWFIPTGYAGFKTIFGKLVEKTYTPGLNWIIPVITDVYVMDTTVQTVNITDTKKTKTRNDISMDYTITYKLNETYVFQVFKQLRTNYWSSFAKWIDAVIDTSVGWLTYPEFQIRKDDIETMISKLINEEVDAKCTDMSRGMASRGRSTIRYDINVITEDIPSMEDPSKMVTIEKHELSERRVIVDGVNFFEFINLKINRIKFEPDYEQAIAKVAVARAKTVETEELKKQLETQAEARKNAMILEAEGKAEAMRLQGASENEVKRVFGEILRDYPDLVRDQVAKNLPKVLGGTTVVDAGKIVP